MKSFDLAIVGGGLASARAIKSFRESGGEGSIALFSKDSTLPYHRPPLSKKFLRGETDEEPLVEDEQFYVDHGVEVMLETSVESVDAQAHELEVDGERVGYGKLLLATGAWPRMLADPGCRPRRHLHAPHGRQLEGDPGRGRRRGARGRRRRRLHRDGGRGLAAPDRQGRVASSISAAGSSTSSASSS